MNAAIVHSPEKNSADYSETKIKKPVLIKSVKLPKAVVENSAVKYEENTYTFVGIAG